MIRLVCKRAGGTLEVVPSTTEPVSRIKLRFHENPYNPAPEGEPSVMFLSPMQASALADELEEWARYCRRHSTEIRHGESVAQEALGLVEKSAYPFTAED